jgi:hypothetical protein
MNGTSWFRATPPPISAPLTARRSPLPPGGVARLRTVRHRRALLLAWPLAPRLARMVWLPLPRKGHAHTHTQHTARNRRPHALCYPAHAHAHTQHTARSRRASPRPLLPTLPVSSRTS